MKNDVWIIILFLAIIAGVALSAAASPAIASETCRLGPQSYIAIQPSESEEARAEVVFDLPDLRSNRRFFYCVATLDGLSPDGHGVLVIVQRTPDGDVMTVWPPGGLRAEPARVRVPENGAGVIHIYEDAIG
jgi:hypothetical protein